MTKRISKINLPHPMPVSFATQLSTLMTGYDLSTNPGRFAVASILNASRSDTPLSLVGLYHEIKNNDIDAGDVLRHEAEHTKNSELSFKIAAIFELVDLIESSLEEHGDTVAGIRDSVCEAWSTGMRQLAIGAEPFSSRVAALLATFGSLDTSASSGMKVEALSSIEAALQAVSANSVTSPGRRIVLVPAGTDPMAFLQNLCLSMPPPPVPNAKAPSAPATVNEVLDPTKPAFQVYRQADIVSLVQRMPSTQGPGEGNAQQRRLLESMADNNGSRTLVEVPEGEPLKEMYRRFPHFKDVLDMIDASLSLAGCGDEGSPVSIPPILLRGEPGTGKTYFAQELARVMGLHFVERDLSVITEAFVLAGMDAGWKNSKPGIVFDALVNGKTANPLILLNEVDKASTTGTHNSPLAPLYSLLEPTSSSQFVDEFIPSSIDASRVIWVLTANNGDIPLPALSRLETFDIRTPTNDECRIIAGSVWTSICTRGMPKGHGFCEELGEPMLDFMSKLSPRVMRKALTRAAGHAAQDKRKYLKLEDLELSRKRYAPVEKVSIGFV